MLSITATNFGVNPSDIQIKEYHEQNLLVLEGDISVDTTAAEYTGIRPMKLTVADLPFAKSRIGTALVTAASEGVNYCTLAKVWIADKNTICIGKIIPYKSLGSYNIHLNTMLIPVNNAGQVALNLMKTYVPQAYSLVEDGKTVIYIWPVEDPDKLDALRKSVSLMPIGEYLEMVRQQGVEIIYDSTKTVKDFK